jgi:hypothetical protein
MAFHPDRLHAACRRSLIRRNCSGLQQPHATYYRVIIVHRCFTALAVVLKCHTRQAKYKCRNSASPFRYLNRSVSSNSNILLSTFGIAVQCPRWIMPTFAERIWWDYWQRSRMAVDHYKNIGVGGSFQESSFPPNWRFWFMIPRVTPAKRQMRTHVESAPSCQPFPDDCHVVFPCNEFETDSCTTLVPTPMSTLGLTASPPTRFLQGFHDSSITDQSSCCGSSLLRLLPFELHAVLRAEGYSFRGAAEFRSKLRVVWAVSLTGPERAGSTADCTVQPYQG